MRRAATIAAAAIACAGCTSSGGDSTTSSATTASTSAQTATASTTRLDPIVVDSPQAFAVVQRSAGIDLTGTADVFEATINWHLDHGKTAVQSGVVTASCGSGCRGTFHTHITFSKAVNQTNYTLILEERSAKDNSVEFAVPVPITIHDS